MTSFASQITDTDSDVIMQNQCKEFKCRCFVSRNIFIKTYKLHVMYQNDQQFYQDYRQHLRMKGCSTNQQYEDVLKEIDAELSRRKNFHVNAYERHHHILQNYTRLHPHLWHFNSIFMDERIHTLADKCKQNPSFSFMEDIIADNGGLKHGNRLYQFPVLTEKMCRHLVEEFSNFENSSCPKGRPNTMNKFGISLDELGMSDGLLNDIIIHYIRPISGILFEDWGGKDLDSFKAFIVIYGPEKDSELSLHYDNAEVTLNVCLTNDFDGGNLEFGSLWHEHKTDGVKHFTNIQHHIGMGILHRGQHMHKALPTVSGQRCNLVIWMRSSAIRNQCCPMCEEEPSLLEVPFAGDGFIPQNESAQLPCVAV